MDIACLRRILNFSIAVLISLNSSIAQSDSVQHYFDDGLKPGKHILKADAGAFLIGCAGVALEWNLGRKKFLPIAIQVGYGKQLNYYGPVLSLEDKIGKTVTNVNGGRLIDVEIRFYDLFRSGEVTRPEGFYGSAFYREHLLQFEQDTYKSKEFGAVYGYQFLLVKGLALDFGIGLTLISYRLDEEDPGDIFIRETGINTPIQIKLGWML